MPKIIDFSAIPSGVVLSEERVTQLADRAAETGAAFARLIERLMAAYAEAKNNYTREADELVRQTLAGSDRTERAALAAERPAAERFAKLQAANRVSAVKRNLMASSEADRRTMLDLLARFAAEAEQIASVTQSPMQLLGRTALGDSRRATIQATLAEAGPVELETAARTSVLLGDVVMAAAVATVVDRRPRDRRPFSAQAFAERMLGQVWTDLDAKLQGVILAARRAQAAEREFIRGKPDPLTNVSLALADRAIQTTAPAAEADTDDDNEGN